MKKSVFIASYTSPGMSKPGSADTSKPKSNEDYSILLIDLDLIRQSRETKEYYFNIEGKRNVTSDIFLYAILSVKGNDNSIPFEYIQEKIGLPFCMNELETIHMLQELSPEYIIPKAFDKRVGPAVAKAVAEAAKRTGVARI